MKNQLIMISILSTLALAGCSSNSVKPADSSSVVTATTNTSKPMKVESEKIDLAIARVNSELAELDSLESKTYAKSLKPDAKALKELQKKIQDYGTVETLQANLKVLQDLKTDEKVSQAL